MKVIALLSVLLVSLMVPGATAATNEAPVAALTVTPVDDKTLVSRTFSASGSADADGSIVRYVFDFGDGSSAVDTSAAEVTYSYGTPGVYNATVRVFDDQGASSGLAAVEVVARNRPPTLQDVTDKLVAEDDMLQFALQASDPEGGAVSLRVGPLPSGATFADGGDGTGTFTWTPDYDDAGSYDLVATASDGLAETTDAFTIFVKNKDRPPSILPMGTIKTREDARVEAVLRATDPDGDKIRLSLSSSPQMPEASFTDRGDGSGLLSWRPPVGSQGRYDVALTARSNHLFATGTFPLHVEPGFLLEGPVALETAPGTPVVLRANLTNPFPDTEDLILWATDSAGWDLVAPTNATLAPGETRVFEVQVTPGADLPSSDVRLHAVSSLSPASTLTFTWTVHVPVLVDVVPDKALYRAIDIAAGPIAGRVHLSYLDGSPADVDLVRVEQRPGFVSAATKSTVTALKETTATYRFTYHAVVHPTAYLTGFHAIEVTLSRSTETSVALVGGYTVQVV
ncbi:MAG: PKD domain-containing protein [Euryarchaeota archaeon]|nr:PKD domain-containing protein [Euryarchaeota archaeon]